MRQYVVGLFARVCCVVVCARVSAGMGRSGACFSLALLLACEQRTRLLSKEGLGGPRRVGPRLMRGWPDVQCLPSMT
jgi:hypothetical protein